jgi:hypothetical protein
MIFTGCFMTGCQQEDPIVDVIGNTDNSSLEIADFKNWFNSQGIVSEFTGKQEPDWNKAELKLLPDGKCLEVSIEIYKGKNTLGNDSIRKLLIANVKNSFTGGVKVFSFYNEENADTKYYSLSGQILEEGEYYAPKQLYVLLKRYTDEEGRGIVRLKIGNESNDDPCQSVGIVPGSATPKYINGFTNPNAYNCHTYVWGTLSSNDPCYNPTTPLWNNCPNIAGSGYSQVSTPQVDDRWVSYGYVSNRGYVPIHSAIVIEVKNGKVTKLLAKCGYGEIRLYDPDCPDYEEYMTDDVKYYR